MKSQGWFIYIFLLLELYNDKKHFLYPIFSVFNEKLYQLLVKNLFTLTYITVSNKSSIKIFIKRKPQQESPMLTECFEFQDVSNF